MFWDGFFLIWKSVLDVNTGKAGAILGVISVVFAIVLICFGVVALIIYLEDRREEKG